MRRGRARRRTRAGRLFYVHLNDNDRGADWDMPVASINPWDTPEVLWYMDRLGYDGWIAYDVFHPCQ